MQLFVASRRYKTKMAQLQFYFIDIGCWTSASISCDSRSLSGLTTIFPGGPWLVGARMSPFWILLELRVMEVVVTCGTIGHAKLQSNHHHQLHHPTLYRLDILHVDQPSVCITEGSEPRLYRTKL